MRSEQVACDITDGVGEEVGSEHKIVMRVG